jgi:hypothetical protein
MANPDPTVKFDYAALTAIGGRFSRRADDIVMIGAREMADDFRLAARMASKFAGLRFRVGEIADMALDQAPPPREISVTPLPPRRAADMPVHIPPDLPEASPIIISESPTHIVIALEIPKATLGHHRRFLELLLAAAVSVELPSR